jgi:hypothetical protein
VREKIDAKVEVKVKGNVGRCKNGKRNIAEGRSE